MARMKLTTKAIETKLLKAGDRAMLTGETAKVASVKIFDPTGSFTFYGFDAERTEDGDLIVFGYTTGMQSDEWGKVSIRELANTRVRFGLYLERDKFFSGVTGEELENGARP